MQNVEPKKPNLAAWIRYLRQVFPRIIMIKGCGGIRCSGRDSLRCTQPASIVGKGGHFSSGRRDACNGLSVIATAASRRGAVVGRRCSAERIGHGLDAIVFVVC